MTEQFVEIEGARLWTISQGEGFPVMLCNGGPGCADYLQPVADMMLDMVNVLRFEQRGCGRSDPSSVYDLKTCVTDLDAIRQHYGFERWIIGGHSWGADLALIYALAYPQHCAGLICIAGGRMHNDREWHKVYRTRKDTEGEAIPESEYPPNDEVNEQLNRDKKRYIQQPLLFRQISQLTVPALFLYGQDDIRPSWPVEQVSHLMPNGHFVRITNAPHMPWLTQPEAVRTQLRRFVAEIV